MGMAKSIGIWRSWALVAGMMIGSGIFTLPALLAPYGSYSFIGWGVTGFGAICLALSYSYLSSRKPGLGGPYFYVLRHLVQFQLQLCVGAIGFRWSPLSQPFPCPLLDTVKLTCRCLVMNHSTAMYLLLVLFYFLPRSMFVVSAKPVRCNFLPRL
jgi:hypothetical protein